MSGNEAGRARAAAASLDDAGARARGRAASGALEADAAVHPRFATPVAQCRMSGSGGFDDALKRTILAREAAGPGTRHSNLGGWQSSWDFEDWGGPEAATLVGAVRALAGRLTCDRKGGPVEIEWRTNAWANVNRSGHGNEFHAHPGAFWSATYYVDDGGAGADPSLGGEFEIQDPRGVAPAMLAPALGFAMPGGQSAGASELIRPEKGLLLLFPSWLSHGVRPYRGGGVRISVAVNLTPVPGPWAATES